MAPGDDNEATVVMPRRPPPVEVGDILGHTYRIEALLGKGGMGAVYRARHVVLATEHAIKVILWELSSDPQIVALLNQEAQTLRSLKNEAVVEYQGLMLDEYGRRYLIMEFVDGPSLGSELKRRRFSPDEVRQLRDRVARGLAAAHGKGIFHRDVSPDNIILPGGHIENAKIIDFGIAKSTATGDRTIIGGDFAGKYSYASPEQTGMFDGKIDGRSDIYSLGLVLATAAIGFGGKLDMGQSPNAVYKARQSVPDLRGVPQELRGEIAAMLQPNPVDRPQSMEAVIGLTAPTARDRRDTRVSAGRRERRLWPGIAGITVAVFALLGVAGEYEWTHPVQDKAPPAVSSETSSNDTPPSPSGMDDVVATGDTAVPGTPPLGVITASDDKALTPMPAPAVSPTTVALAPTFSPERRREIELRIQETLKDYSCAAVTSTVGEDGVVQLKGLISSADDLARFQQAIAKIPDIRFSGDIAVFGAPQCEAARLLQNATASVNAPSGPQLRFNHEDRIYRAQDILIVDATATRQFAGYLYVDYYDAEGNVVHMLPTPLRSKNAMKRGEDAELGAPREGGKTGQRVYEISEPFGPALVTAISSPNPLFPPRAEEMEDAQSYLTALNRALKASAAGSTVLGSYAPISTVPK
jgi:eukaryotic-like serine/threonine-protein kinase